jgi:hypothetical protein
VPAFDGLDARIAWLPNPKLTVELIGRDLLGRNHEEFGSSFLSDGAHRIARSVFGRVSVRF